MNKALVAGVAGLVILGGAGYAVLVLPGQQFRSSLDETIKTLPETATVRYAAADYALLDNRATLTGVTIDIRTQPAYTVKIDRIELIDPAADLAEAWNRAKADPAAVDPALALPVAGQIEITGVRGEMPAGPDAAAASYTVDRLGITGMKLFPKALLAFDPEQMFQAIEALQAIQPETEPDPAAVMAQMAPLLQQYAALYLGFAYDSYDMEGVRVAAAVQPAGAADPAAAPVAMALDVAKMTSAGYDRGMSAASTLTGYTQKMEGLGDCTIERITVNPVDVRAAATRLLAGEAPSLAMLDVITVDGFDMAGMACQGAEGPRVSFDKLGFGEMRFTSGKPAKMALSLSGLKLPAEAFALAGPENPLAMLGLEGVTISAGGGYTWDVAAGRLSVADLNLNIAELGHLRIDADLADVPEDPEALDSVTLTRARLHYADASLANRLIDQFAAQQGEPPAAFRANLLSVVAQQGQMLELPPEIPQALMAFLQSPTTLTVALSPPQAVQLASLEQAAQAMPPAQLVQQLGLTVTAGR